MRVSAVLIISALLLLLSGCSSRTPAASKLASANSPLLPVTTLAAFEQQWRGVPYRYGGNSKHGIDCSGFVQQTYQHFTDIQLPRTTAAQAKFGKQISPSQLASGDLVFFKTGWSSRHVGIYLSHNNFMHASTSEGVTISSLNTPYWRDAFWQARRITF